MPKLQITFECDAVKSEGIVGTDIKCCRECHKGYDEAPFIVVKHQKRVVCCTVASAYNIEYEKRQWLRMHE